MMYNNTELIAWSVRSELLKVQMFNGNWLPCVLSAPSSSSLTVSMETKILFVLFSSRSHEKEWEKPVLRLSQDSYEQSRCNKLYSQI